MKGRQDHFARRAKREGFEARSVYKLSAVDERLRLLRPGQRVLDLGASPGSWSRYALERIGDGGFLLAVDLNPLSQTLPANARAVQLDSLDPQAQERLAPDAPFDVILSDMAPKTTGVPFADHFRSIELGRGVLALCARLLRPGGTTFVKLFDGEDLPAFRKEFARHFRRASLEKPLASRKDSVEVFLLGRDFTPAVEPA